MVQIDSAPEGTIGQVRGFSLPSPHSIPLQILQRARVWCHKGEVCKCPTSFHHQVYTPTCNPFCVPSLRFRTWKKQMALRGGHLRNPGRPTLLTEVEEECVLNAMKAAWDRLRCGQGSADHPCPGSNASTSWRRSPPAGSLSQLGALIQAEE